MPKIAFHVTPRTNLVSIRREGLMPTQHRTISSSAGVMMYATHAQAKHAVEHTHYVRWTHDALVILAVDIEGYEVVEHGPDQLLVKTESWIDQSRVSVVQVGSRHVKIKVEDDEALAADIADDGSLAHLRV